MPSPRMLASCKRAICSQSAGIARRSVITSLLLQFSENELRHGLQRIEYPSAAHGNSLERRLALEVELPVHFVHGHRGGQIAFVELQNVRDQLQLIALLFEVPIEVLQRLDVCLHARFLRVGHEDDSVDTLQNELPRGIVEHLPRHGVKVEAGLEAADRAEIEGKKVEEQRTVGFRGQGDQLPLRLRVGLVVDPLQVGRLTAKAGAVVDDFAVDLASGVVDERHAGYSLNRLSISSSVISAKGESKRFARLPRSASDFFMSCSKVRSSSVEAFFTRSRTSPRDERSSKMTTRITRCATREIWMLSRSPSWKRIENSFSPMSLANPSVAATFPAVSEASEVASTPAMSP